MKNIKLGEAVFTDSEGNYTINTEQNNRIVMTSGYPYELKNYEYTAHPGDCRNCSDKCKQVCADEFADVNCLESHSEFTDAQLVEYFGCVGFDDEQFAKDIASAGSKEERLKVILGDEYCALEDNA